MGSEISCFFSREGHGPRWRSSGVGCQGAGGRDGEWSACPSVGQWTPAVRSAPIGPQHKSDCGGRIPQRNTIARPVIRFPAACLSAIHATVPVDASKCVRTALHHRSPPLLCSPVLHHFNVKYQGLPGLWRRIPQRVFCPLERRDPIHNLSGFVTWMCLPVKQPGHRIVAKKPPPLGEGAGVGWVRGQNKVGIPETRLQFPAPLINAFFFLRTSFLMWVGGWVGGWVGRPSPPLSSISSFQGCTWTGKECWACRCKSQPVPSTHHPGPQPATNACSVRTTIRPNSAPHPPPPKTLGICQDPE